MEMFWWIAGAFTCVVCTIVGTVGNGFTIAIFIKFEKFRNAIGYLILSLAVVDLLGSMLVSSINIYFYANLGKWKFSKPMCIFNEILTYGNVATSSIMIFLIAINRCIKICYSAEIYQRFYSTKSVLIMILVAWIYAHSIYMLCSFNIGGELIHDQESETCALKFGSLWIGICVSFFVTAMSVVICYAKIYRTVLKSRNSVRRHNISSSGEEEDNANARLLKMLVTTTVAYILGFVGPLIIGLVEYFSGRQGQKSAVEHFFYKVPIFVGVILNPIIYGLTNSQYREAYKELLLSSFLKTRSESQPDTTAMTTTNTNA